MRRDLQVLTVEDETRIELRALTGHRKDLVCDRTRAMNRLRGHLLEYFPALEQAFNYSASRVSLLLLTGYATPGAIRTMGESRLARWLRAQGCRTAVATAATAVAAAKSQSSVLPAVQVVTVAGRETVDPEVLVAVSAAVRDRQILRFSYSSPEAGGAERPPRRVEPHAVIARAGRWYLLARAPDRDDWRTYRADRIHPKDPTRVPFAPREVPGGEYAAFVESRFRGGDGTSGSPCVGTAELAVAAQAIRPYLTEDDVLQELVADSCRLTAGSWSWIALVARFAGLGVPFTLEGPPELRAAAAELARRC